MPTTSPPAQVAARPCLITAAWGGRLIGVCFAATVVLFVAAVVMLA